MHWIVARRNVGRLVCGIVLFVVAAVTVSAAKAAPLVHGNFSGVTVDFLAVTEDSTTDDVSAPGGALYGAPTLVNDTLVFSTPNFAASAAGGSSDFVNGTLTLQIQAKPGFFIERIAISEIGDYALAGIGGAGTSVSIFGALTVNDLTFSTGNYSDPISFTPGDSFSLGAGDSAGVVSGTAEVDLVNDFFLVGVTSVGITFDNNLLANSEAGTTATIKKAFEALQSITVSTSPGPIVPEPSSLALASIVCASLLGWSIRRRR